VVVVVAAAVAAVGAAVGAVRRRSLCVSARGCGLWPQGELARWAAAAGGGGGGRRFVLCGADLAHAAALRRMALATLLHDRLQPHPEPFGLCEVLGLAGARLDAHRLRMLFLALPPHDRGAAINALAPQERAKVEALLYVAGWAGAPGWMLTTDAAGGFRQLHHFPQFRLAVSRSDKLAGPVAIECPPPPGWRLATAAELRAAGFRASGAREPEQSYYEDQAGWDECTWDGVERCIFVTADWAEVDPEDGGAVWADQSEGDLSYATAAFLRSTLPHECFAGVVCAWAD